MHKFWLHILNHWMFGLVSMFAAGAVAELGVGGGDGAEVENVSDGSEVETDTGGGDASDDSSAEATPDSSADAEVEEKPDGRQMSADWKKAITDLKATNPKLANEIKNLYFGHKAFRAEFPGGIKEVREIKQTLSEIGGKEGFETVKNELGAWNALNDKFIAGDPSFVNDIAASDPESFAGAAPHMISKFSEVDPEGYQRTLSSIFSATLKNAGVLNTLWQAKLLLSSGKQEEAVKLIDQIEGWAGEIEKIGSQQPKAKQSDPREQEFAKKEQELRDQKEKLFNSSLSNDFIPYRQSAIEKELKQYTKGAKIDPERMEIFAERVVKKIAGINDKNPDYRKTFDKYYSAQDKDGLLKFVKERFDKLIPDAVKSVYKILPMGPAVAQKKAVPNAATAPAAVGWVKVSGPPRPEEIDHSKTSFDMKFRSQAVLKNGKKVTW